MARFSRLHTLHQMAATGIIPLFYHPDFETACRVLDACYAGGVRVFEITNRGDRAHELFRDLVLYAEKNAPDLILGAGTVMDAGTAALFIQLGANFIVTPCIHEDTARTCNRRKIPWVPGCATLTEISRAEELGAEVVKLFPGDILGPAFIKGMKGPMPWSSVMVTGGVQPTAANLSAWRSAGATCVGMGSQLFPAKLLAEKRWQDLEETVRTCMEIWKK